jgi:hypothetical protein
LRSKSGVQLSGMDDLKTQVFLEGVEIAIAMKKR